MNSTALSPARLARLEKIADREEILECMTRAFRAFDRADRDLFLTTFHPDATIDLFGRTYTPAGLYDEVATAIYKVHVSIHHYLMNLSCDIDGDAAHTEGYQLFIGHNADKTSRASGGRVLERHERRNGEWKIAFRYTLVEWSGEIQPGVARSFQTIQDMYTNGKPSWTKNDPSYRRPLTNLRLKDIIGK